MPAVGPPPPPLQTIVCIAPSHWGWGDGNGHMRQRRIGVMAEWDARTSRLGEKATSFYFNLILINTMNAAWDREGSSRRESSRLCTLAGSRAIPGTEDTCM